MTPDDVRSLYAFNRWANRRFLGVLETLDEERLARPIESSFPSLVGTFAHMVAAEWVWLRRWLGENPTAFPGWLVAPRLDDLAARLAEVEAERAAFLAGLGDADLQARVSYRTLAGDPFANRLLDLLLHVVNHASYHRGQLTTMLRQVGATPPATDYVLFDRERAG
jgi:uncharacterized damage-inducible protein DinB